MSVTSELDEPGARVDELLATARRLVVPMAISIAVGAVVSIAAGAVVVRGMGGSIDRLDVSLVGRLVAGRSHVFDQLTAVAATFADATVVIALWLGAMLASLWLTREMTLPLFIAFVVGGENLTYLITTVVVARPRPPFEALGHSLTAGSFPSGHVGGAVSLYGAVVIAYFWYRSSSGRPVGRSVVAAVSVGVAALALSVGFSRLYGAQHHPTDVVWGAALGVTWLVLGGRFVLGIGTGPTRGQFEPG
jgi:membrane-associated phospholipid phosphatase